MRITDLSCEGGNPFTYGPLAYFLKNRIYVGEMHHSGKWFKGEHQAILDRQTFERIQDLLESNRITRRISVLKVAPCSKANCSTTKAIGLGRPGTLKRSPSISAREIRISIRESGVRFPRSPNKLNHLDRHFNELLPGKRASEAMARSGGLCALFHARHRKSEWSSDERRYLISCPRCLRVD
jgi:Recombinase